MPSQLTPTKIQVTCRANTYRHTGARNHLSWCAVRGCCEYLALLARQKGGRSRSHDAMIRVVSGGCRGNSRFTEVYVDNMHKDQAVRATVRKHSQEGDDDTDYAIAEGGQLFIGCGGGGTSFVVIGCKVLKGEAEKE